MEKKVEHRELSEKIGNLEKRLREQKEKEAELLKRISELEKTEIYYNALMHNTEDYVLVCDNDGVSLSFNESYKKAGERMLDIELKPGMKPHKMSGEPRIIEYWDSLQKRVINGEKFTAEFHDEKSGLSFETIFCPIKEDGKISGFTEITRNITEHKRVAKALQDSNAFNASLLEHSPTAILVYGPDTAIMYVNPLFERLTGFTYKEVQGLKIPYPWWVNEPEYGTIEDRKETMFKGMKGAERRYRKKNGEYSWVEINTMPIHHDGKLSYLLSIWIDIAERKKSEQEKESLQEQLQRSQKMESLGLLAGGVAHDLNNVLSGIVSYPELLLMDLPPDSKLKKPLQTIEKSGQKAVAIVQDLLTIARGVATVKEPVNLNDLVDDYLQSPELMRLGQYHPAVEIETDLDSGLLNINGSRIHLGKVIMNLVSNASEAIESKGKVVISTRNCYIDKPLKLFDNIRIGEYALLSVSDNGIGISSSDMNRVFEPFYSKKVMDRSGTGLGLAVVWNVVKEHNGYIDIRSGRGGTTIELYFPITRAEKFEKPLDVPIEMISGNGEKVLVVDDIESQREITCSILTKLKYEADSVSSGEAAVEHVRDHEVDLILLDMIMTPGINGLETYRRLSKIRPGQKVIIVSGFAETEDVKAAQELGAGRFIKKPLTLQTLGVAIREALEKS